MKLKIIFLIIILFCYPLVSQENYKGFRIITWEQIQGQDFTILSDGDNITVIIVNGQTFVIKNQ